MNKFLNIFQRTIIERKWSILIYCLAAILFLWMYIALFPTIQESFVGFVEYFDNFPKAIMDVFGFDSETFMTFEGYLGTEQYSFVWPILLIALVVSLGSSFFAGETEKGTIELLLSQSISRCRIFFGKFFAGVFILFGFVFVSIFVVFPLARIHDISYNTKSFLKLFSVAFIFSLAIFGLSVFFSVVFSEKSKVSFIVVGTLITMYVLNIVSGLKESLDNLKYLSFFYYFKPSDILSYGKINDLALGIFLGTFLVTTILALVWFKKRDIAI